MTLPNMAQWGKIKGINVLATGDFTHPFWFESLKNELEDVGNGLFKLKKEFDRPSGNKIGMGFSDMGREPVQFMLSCEISSIYSQGGKGRRIHTLFFFSNLASVEKFNQELVKRGSNLRSDGRPIVGIPSEVLAEIAFSCDEKALVIPAHAWTPWYSVFGSFSGFDSIEECFGKMADKIYGIESGLSSDPAMNWQVGDLDNRSVLSFSDAHSLEKMGREATVFEGNEISYDCIYDAIKKVSNVSKVAKVSNVKKPSETFETSETFVPSRVAFTIEFWPEEGKYHFTGHRNCNFSQSPEDSAKNGDICPVCHKSLTVGVMHRVKDLETRAQRLEVREKDGVKWMLDPDARRPAYVSLVPLLEILSEVYGVAVGTKKVNDSYLTLINALGSEFGILLRVDIAEIRKLSSDKVAEAISKVRSRDIVVEPGYDGKFGVVKIWENGQDTNGATQDVESQLNLFV
ncbi:MAG TPA: endonuclease Q family protein [Candidatus Saccharimonadales bacterium]|nr:endonuclease Q family protein [Candidatus Saccharimonadales bacterium]